MNRKHYKNECDLRSITNKISKVIIIIYISVLARPFKRVGAVPCCFLSALFLSCSPLSFSCHKPFW